MEEAGLIFLHRRNLTQKDVCQEEGRVLIIPVPQGDVEASAEADLLNGAPRKSLANTKAPVP